MCLGRVLPYWQKLVCLSLASFLQLSLKLRGVSSEPSNQRAPLCKWVERHAAQVKTTLASPASLGNEWCVCGSCFLVESALVCDSALVVGAVGRPQADPGSLKMVSLLPLGTESGRSSRISVASGAQLGRWTSDRTPGVLSITSRGF